MDFTDILRSFWATEVLLSPPRITEQFFHLEGTYNHHLSSCLTDSGLAKSCVVKGIVQLPLEHWRAGGIDLLSRKPGPVFEHPLGKEILPNIWSKPPMSTTWFFYLAFLWNWSSCQIFSCHSNITSLLSTFIEFKHIFLISFWVTTDT